jgi:hypothetical protein
VSGSAPVTRASGKSTAVLHRRVKTNGWPLTASPGARAHYDRRNTAGDRHVAAQRNLFNRLLGCLHHCLQTRQTYNEATAFPHDFEHHQGTRRLMRSQREMSSSHQTEDSAHPSAHQLRNAGQAV